MYPFRTGLDGSQQCCVRGDTASPRNQTPVAQLVAKYISEIPLKNENRSSLYKFLCFAFVLVHSTN